MKINADLSKRAVVNSEQMDWMASPAPGVERRMLDRDGDEVARCTTIVRYAAGSAFPAHEHGGGEEILVLDGVFSDENGDYPAGTYVHHPVGSRHTPASRDGCTLLVKLHQMDPADQETVVVDTRSAAWQPGRVEGLESMELHEFNGERSYLARFGPGIQCPHHDHPGGEEILVLEGTLLDEDGRYPPGTWIRHPAGSEHAPYSDEGCILFVKTGHLR